MIYLCFFLNDFKENSHENPKENSKIDQDSKHSKKSRISKKKKLEENQWNIKDFPEISFGKINEK